MSRTERTDLKATEAEYIHIIIAINKYNTKLMVTILRKTKG